VANKSRALVNCSEASTSAERSIERCRALPHHSIASSFISRLTVMMCRQFRLCRGMLAQNLGNSAVQYLAPGFEEVS
jgi:hypothetical protein